MKIKSSPVVYVFVFYTILGVILILASFSLNNYLGRIDQIDVTAVAYIALIIGSMFLTVSLFSFFRIPFFHYLLKMFNLWLVTAGGVVLWLYFEHRHLLMQIFSTDTQHNIAKDFSVKEPDIFQPPMSFAKTALIKFNEQYVFVLIAAVIILAVIQLILYMPSSLRYVHHTYISPFRYTIKHIFISIAVLAPLLFVANLYIKLDSSISPNLEQFLATKPETVADDDNAFYKMLTVWNEGGNNTAVEGKRWVAEYKKMLTYFKKQNVPVDISAYPRLGKLNLHGMKEDDQARINQLYIQRLTNKNPALHKAIARYALRYKAPLNLTRSLYKYDRYQNPIGYADGSITRFFKDYSESMLSLHRLNLLVSLMEHGVDGKSLIEDVKKDYWFNMLIIRGESDPAVKMTYMKKQAVTVEFVNYLLKDPAFQKPRIFNMISGMQALVAEVLDNSRIARKQLRVLKEQVDQGYAASSKSQSPAGYIVDYTFKHNRTLNCIYENAVREYNLDNKDPVAHISAQAIGKFKPSLGNVIGDVICKAAIPEDASRYYVMGTELNGMIMMLKARSTLLDKKILKYNINSFLVNNSKKYFNPFTGEALKWDKAAGRLYFEYNNGERDVKVEL